MKKLTLSILSAGIIASQSVFGFCGFYVAKADAKLFNKTSQVIYVRNQNKSTITMASDYQGDLKDFAMVIPVPVILEENQIRVINQNLFTKMDDYSSPRLAVYYDQSPCYEERFGYYKSAEISSNAMYSVTDSFIEESEDQYNVTIEAQYEVGEYDILILSARDSHGLESWLIDNDYKIPVKAKEVLTPYIKDGLKFFVAKVNIDRMKLQNAKFLSPIQMSFESNRFTLPIRLGMANANGDQDMIVYCLTANGRVESTNYRNVKIPSDMNVPLFVRDDFSTFYKQTFDETYREAPASVFLEYSWDLSSSNFVKCDPCNTTPPLIQDMITAGVDWLDSTPNRGGSNYQGNVYFTRMHVRYNRQNFPQDLAFIETNNKTRHQGRYVLHQPAQINGTCDQLESYYQEVLTRRYEELDNYADLTGMNPSAFSYYTNEYKTKLKMEQERKGGSEFIMPIFKDIWPFFVPAILLIGAVVLNNRKKSLKLSV